MTHIHKTAIVPYSPAQMYALVNDVQHYQDFLPWCDESIIHEYDETHMRATVKIKKSGIKQYFTTHNTLTLNERIELTLVEGPFRKLTGVWEFKPMKGEGCRVSLDLQVEFKQGLINRAFKNVFEPIASHLVDAFCQRAGALYD
ncbi:MAG: type II toxin-antitoxin system RatA family toxin [Gammaproteobacteria bacterium]